MKKKEWASSHTPRSNIAWECCIQWMAFPSIRDGQSDNKGNINCSSKGSTSISCKNAHLHIMSFITTQFHAILLSGFSSVVLTNCFSSIFNFPQFSKFKKGVTPRKKNGIKISCGYAHLHIMSFITTKFQEILLSRFRGVALTRKTGLTDGSKTLYPPQLVAWGIIKLNYI